MVGILNFFALTRDFNPGLQNITSTHVWLRFMVFQEYWRPICTNSASTKPVVDRTFC